MANPKLQTPNCIFAAMTRHQLVTQIREKQSYLIVGLDTDITKIPKHLLTEPDPVFAFNKAIIDATKDLCVGYKINTAFYEAAGVKGWVAMEKLFITSAMNILKLQMLNGVILVIHPTNMPKHF